VRLSATQVVSSRDSHAQQQARWGAAELAARTLTVAMVRDLWHVCEQQNSAKVNMVALCRTMARKEDWLGSRKGRSRRRVS
jgi:hypothetical protein